MNKITASLIIATVLGLTFTGTAGADDFTVDQKFAHVDGPDYVTEATVEATIGNGDTIVVNTSDAYNGRSNSSQVAERVNIYGVNEAGRTLIGTTDDLDDGTESANSSATFTSNGDYTSIFIELDEDTSSPNSVFVNGVTVNRAPKTDIVTSIVDEPTAPAPTIVETHDDPFVPTMIETTPDAPIEPPAAVTPPVTYPKPVGTLPHTGASEAIPFAILGAVLVLAGLGLNAVAKAD